MFLGSHLFTAHPVILQTSQDFLVSLEPGLFVINLLRSCADAE